MRGIRVYILVSNLNINKCILLYAYFSLLLTWPGQNFYFRNLLFSYENYKVLLSLETNTYNTHHR
jgi:hypothetical protein